MVLAGAFKVAAWGALAGALVTALDRMGYLAKVTRYPGMEALDKFLDVLHPFRRRDGPRGARARVPRPHRVESRAFVRAPRRTSENDQRLTTLRLVVHKPRPRIPRVQQPSSLVRSAARTGAERGRGFPCRR